MPLKLEFEYDHVSGLYEVKLENGARFSVKREDISGKLENNLDLYRRAVISLMEDKAEFKASNKFKDREELMKLSAGKSIQVVGKKSKVKPSLDDLELEF